VSQLRWQRGQVHPRPPLNMTGIFPTPSRSAAGGRSPLVGCNALLGGCARSRRVSKAGRETAARRAFPEARFPDDNVRCSPCVPPRYSVRRWSRRTRSLSSAKSGSRARKGLKRAGGSGGQEARVATAAGNGSPRGPGVQTAPACRRCSRPDGAPRSWSRAVRTLGHLTRASDRTTVGTRSKYRRTHACHFPEAAR
jgi:hypothetical protein